VHSSVIITAVTQNRSDGSQSRHTAETTDSRQSWIPDFLAALDTSYQKPTRRQILDTRKRTICGKAENDHIKFNNIKSNTCDHKRSQVIYIAVTSPVQSRMCRRWSTHCRRRTTARDLPRYRRFAHRCNIASKSRMCGPEADCTNGKDPWINFFCSTGAL